jgi:hypothetical protein
MSRLSELPEREKDPGAAVSLGEIFRTKEYMAEIKGALKKGYTFENLAAIFTKRCGVAISARQIKYHFTRAKNLEVKGKSGKTGKKAGEKSAPRCCIQSADSEERGAIECAEENQMASDPAAISSMKVPGFSSENSVAVEAEGNVDPDAFSLDTRPKRS